MKKPKPIDPLALEEFRKTVPAYRQNEKFHFLTAEYDIIKAKFLIQRENLPTQPVEVDAWTKMLALQYPRKADIPKNRIAFSLIAINDDFAEGDQVNTSLPGIIAMRSIKGEKKPLPLFIDGHCRLRRCFLDKKAQFDVHVLPEYLAELCKNG